MFQFQYGAIDGGALSIRAIKVKQFQFQYGAIDGYQDRTVEITEFGFNSSMVQLTVLLLKSLIVYLDRFNSSMVQLTAVFYL